MKNFTALVCLGLAPVTPATARKMNKNMDPAKIDPTTNAQDAPATKALEAAIHEMDGAVEAMTYTGNPDVDFVTKMMAHHRVAIDMATVELEYGKDSKVRKLAENIIKGQGKQTAEMHDWLAKHKIAATPVN